MDDNPYRADALPVETSRSTSTLPAHLNRVAKCVAGSLLIAPTCWLIGRGLIPDDKVALRFSVGLWIVLSTMWVLWMLRRTRLP